MLATLETLALGIVTSDAIDLARALANVAAPTVTKTASAIDPITIGALRLRAPSAWCGAATKVTGGANRGASAPPPLKFTMSSARDAGASPFVVGAHA